MTKSYNFLLPNNFNENTIHMFNLRKVLANDRTTIFQNDEMRFCIDSGKVVRVLLFDENNNILLEKLRNYFYGEEYTLGE